MEFRRSPGTAWITRSYSAKMRQMLAPDYWTMVLAVPWFNRFAGGQVAACLGRIEGSRNERRARSGCHRRKNHEFKEGKVARETHYFGGTFEPRP